MLVHVAVALSVLQGIALRGAKMAVSLSALAHGATPFQVGVLAAAFPVFPLLLAVYAGRVSDRAGVMRPLVGGAFGMAAGMVAPLAVPGYSGLLACALLVGFAQIFFHVAIHNLIGAYGEGEARTRNFATLSLGSSLAAFLGPSICGFAIDGLGFAATFGVMAAIVLLPGAILLAWPRIVPPGAHGHRGEKPSGGSREMLGDPRLIRTLVLSGVTLTGIELFTFYFPVYGRSLALSASAIGLVMSSYAVAAFIVRAVMPRATRTMGELGVLTASLFMAGAAFLAVPFAGQAVLLAGMAFLLGIGLGCAQPLTIILTYNHAPQGRAGEALGLRLTVNKAAQIAVPLAFGAIGTAWGLLPVFWAAGGFLLLGGAVSLRERKRS